VTDGLPEDAGAGPLAVLAPFRLDFHGCLTARSDELFELAAAPTAPTLPPATHALNREGWFGDGNGTTPASK
jgi:hypothetical protein